jgi:hypothetical protein
MADRDPELARSLRGLLQGYRFDELEELLSAALVRSERGPG